jgi:hypothetical protein
VRSDPTGPVVPPMLDFAEATGDLIEDSTNWSVMDVRKTVTDAGYIAIGLGVMGYQQGQTRRRELTGKLDTVTDRVGERGREVQGFLAEGSRQVGARGIAARDRAEEQVRVTVIRVHGLGTDVAKFVEPVVEQVQSQLGELPEKVVQVIEPVAARVRVLTGSPS